MMVYFGAVLNTIIFVANESVALSHHTIFNLVDDAVQAADYSSLLASERTLLAELRKVYAPCDNLLVSRCSRRSLLF